MKEILNDKPDISIESKSINDMELSLREIIDLDINKKIENDEENENSQVTNLAFREKECIFDLIPHPDDQQSHDLDMRNILNRRRNNFANLSKTFKLLHMENDKNTKKVIEKNRLIEAFKVKKENRTVDDIKIIVNYLSDSKLKEIFKNSNDENMQLSFIYYCLSKTIDYEYIQKGQSVFKIGEKGDKFYMILSGNIFVMKLIEKMEEMLIEDYFIYLGKLKKEKELFILKKIVNMNRDKIEVDLDKLDEIIELIFRQRLKSIIQCQSTVEEIQSLFDKFSRNPSNYNIDTNYICQIENKNYLNFITYHNNILKSDLFKVDGLYKNIKLPKENEYKLLITYHYENFLILSEGQYFGDYALETNTQRTATIMVSEESAHLAVIQKEHYDEYIFKEKIKLRNKYVSFLYENFFINFMSKNFFEKKYFESFIFEEYYKDNVLIKETDKIEFVYFIYDGSIKLTCKKNYYEIKEDIVFFSKLDKEIYNEAKEDIELIEYEKKILSNRTVIDDKNLTERLNMTVKIISKNEIIGIENLCYGFNHYCTGSVASNQLSLFKIELNKLKKIIHLESGKNHLKDMSNKKVFNLLFRLIEIKRGLVEKICLKCNEKNKIFQALKNASGKLKEEKGNAKNFNYKSTICYNLDPNSTLKNNINGYMELSSGRSIENIGKLEKYVKIKKKNLISNENLLNNLKENDYKNESDESKLDNSFLEEAHNCLNENENKKLILNFNKLKIIQRDFRNEQENKEENSDLSPRSKINENLYIKSKNNDKSFNFQNVKNPADSQIDNHARHTSRSNNTENLISNKFNELFIKDCKKTKRTKIDEKLKNEKILSNHMLQIVELKNLNNISEESNYFTKENKFCSDYKVKEKKNKRGCKIYYTYNRRDSINYELINHFDKKDKLIEKNKILKLNLYVSNNNKRSLSQKDIDKNSFFQITNNNSNNKDEQEEDIFFQRSARNLRKKIKLDKDQNYVDDDSNTEKGAKKTNSIKINHLLKENKPNKTSYLNFQENKYEMPYKENKTIQSEAINTIDVKVNSDSYDCSFNNKKFTYNKRIKIKTILLDRIKTDFEISLINKEEKKLFFREDAGINSNLTEKTEENLKGKKLTKINIRENNKFLNTICKKEFSLNKNKYFGNIFHSQEIHHNNSKKLESIKHLKKHIENSNFEISKENYPSKIISPEFNKYQLKNKKKNPNLEILEISPNSNSNVEIPNLSNKYIKFNFSCDKLPPEEATKEYDLKLNKMFKRNTFKKNFYNQTLQNLILKSPNNTINPKLNFKFNNDKLILDEKKRIGENNKLIRCFSLEIEKNEYPDRQKILIDNYHKNKYEKDKMHNKISIVHLTNEKNLHVDIKSKFKNTSIYHNILHKYGDLLMK